MNNEETTPVITPASRRDRCFAFLIDQAFASALGIGFFYLTFSDQNPDVHRIIQAQLVVALSFLFKDVFGRSPGKALFDLRIVRADDYSRRANPFLTIFRNILGFFFAIEALVILFNKHGQRIADMATGTTVVMVHSKETNHSVKELIGEVTDDAAESTTCLECHTEIPSGQSLCPNCGWTYKR